MSDIYLNYSREDDDVARKIYDDLEDAEFDVWTDEDYVQGTPEWKQAIRHAIKETECMVVLMSPNAARSDAVEEAVGAARINHLTIFPVLIEGDLRRAVPIGLRVDNFTDLRENYDEEIETFIETIEAFLEGYDDEVVDEWEDEDDFFDDDDDAFYGADDWDDDYDEDYDDEDDWVDEETDDVLIDDEEF